MIDRRLLAEIVEFLAERCLVEPAHPRAADRLIHFLNSDLWVRHRAPRGPEWWQEYLA